MKLIPLSARKELLSLFRGDIAKGFEQKCGLPIAQCLFKAEIDFYRNDQLVRECQNPFAPAAHRTGSIDSLDKIVLIPKDQKNS